MASQAGVYDYENTMKIYSKSQGSGSTTIDFTEGDLLAAAYSEDNSNVASPISMVTIFDNEVFNQDIYVTNANVSGTQQMNYYIELEIIDLTDVQATQLTLKNLRTIASR